MQGARAILLRCADHRRRERTGARNSRNLREPWRRATLTVPARTLATLKERTCDCAISGRARNRSCIREPWRRAAWTASEGRLAIVHRRTHLQFAPPAEEAPRTNPPDPNEARTRSRSPVGGRHTTRAAQRLAHVASLAAQEPTPQAAAAATAPAATAGLRAGCRGQDNRPRPRLSPSSRALASSCQHVMCDQSALRSKSHS